MSTSTRCPKCGLTQLSRESCKACGAPLPSAAPSSAARAAVHAAAPLMPRTAPPIVPGGPPPDVRAWAPAAPASDGLDPVFDRDRFLLRQRVLTVNQKYEVWDEAGQPILYVERPAHFLRNLGAVLAGLAAGAILGVPLLLVATSMKGADGLSAVLFVLAIVLGLSALVLVSAALSEKRHITFYRDDSKHERLLEIEQDHKLFLINHTYTVRDADGNALATLGKNIFTDILRKRWTCDVDGQRVCVAKESLVHAIVSRLLGKFFPMNFTFHLAPDGEVAGQFNRRFTLLDRYVLDLSADQSRRLDRRLGLALGIMLDTGERR
jgi:uncharacterized protein YxjI